MYPEQSSELSLNIPARCISAVPGDKNHSRFVVGTCSSASAAASSKNQIYLVRYDEEQSEVVIDTQLDHYTGEVWCCSSCPLDKRLLVTSGGGGGVTSSVLGSESSTVLWRLPQDIFSHDEEQEHQPMDEDEASRVDTLTTTLRGAIDRGQDSVHSLEEVCTLVHTEDRSSALKGRVSDIVWNPDCWHPESTTLDSSGSTCNMITVGQASNIVTTWSIGTSSALPIQRIHVVIESAAPRAKLIPAPTKAAWDPHDTNMMAITSGPDVALYDLRSSQKASGIVSPCHSLGVTSLDYNPNKPHVLVTSGQEGFIKFWDLRMSVTQPKPTGVSSMALMDIASFPQIYKKQAHPLKVVQGGHSHWVSMVQYNRAHDQLLLTGGTVGLVNLWRIQSWSSSTLADLGVKDNSLSTKKNNKVKNDHHHPDDTSVSTHSDRDPSKDDTENTNVDPDVCVDTMELNDSVYSLAWSAADPWVYAALCCDGTVAVRNVPSKEKYKILL